MHRNIVIQCRERPEPTYSVEKLRPASRCFRIAKMLARRGPSNCCSRDKSPKQRTLRAVGDWENRLRVDRPSFSTESTPFGHSSPGCEWLVVVGLKTFVASQSFYLGAPADASRSGSHRASSRGPFARLVVGVRTCLGASRRYPRIFNHRQSNGGFLRFCSEFERAHRYLEAARFAVARELL